MACGILTLLFLTRCETRGILKIISSNSSYRETYNRIKNSLYSKILHSHSVSKADFVNITTALLTQRCAICFLQPIIFSTARTRSPTKPNPATSAPYQSPWMCSPVTILFSGLCTVLFSEIFVQVTWKWQHLWKPQIKHIWKEGRGERATISSERTTNQERKVRKHFAFL